MQANCCATSRENGPMSNEPKTGLLDGLPPISELLPLGYLYLRCWGF